MYLTILKPERNDDMTDKYEQLKKNIKTYTAMYEPSLFTTTLDSARMAIVDLQEENANFITTIESQHRELNLKDIEINHYKPLVELKDTLLESQKEEIERLRKSLIYLLPNVRGIEITIESALSEIVRLSHETP